MARKDYVSKRTDSGLYIYVRRVPKKVAHLVGKTVIRKDLGTDDVILATLQAREINSANEALWAALLRGANPETSLAKYESAVRAAAAFGFSYRTTNQILSGRDDDVLDRVDVAQDHLRSEPVVHALLGGIAEPKVRFSDLLGLYERHNAAAFEGISANQYRKHKVPRERAIAYVISVLSDMELGNVTRDDALRYRDWWVEKMKAEGLKADSANRSFSDIKGMLTVVDTALRTNYGSVWETIRIKATNKTKTGVRPPYPFEFVQDHILKPGAMDGLNLEARMVVYLMIETGLRPSEACNLRKEDIFLSAKIPYISVTERDDRRRKTEYSVRTIPLVGVALWAMKQVPNGFPSYADKEDTLSATINKFLWDNDLRPTKKHVLYSLRHTFQDRILAAKAQDRLQADLMGHEFERPKYGEGASLEQKHQLLDSIKFKWDV